VHFVALDANAERWIELSHSGCWVRHPEAVGHPELVTDLKYQLARFEQLGYELAILEHDLTLCINELLLDSRLYRAPDDSVRRKFAIVYHTDNFYVRVSRPRISLDT